jgi:hypothetical protein
MDSARPGTLPIGMPRGRALAARPAAASRDRLSTSWSAPAGPWSSSSTAVTCSAWAGGPNAARRRTPDQARLLNLIHAREGAERALEASSAPGRLTVRQIHRRPDRATVLRHTM